MQVAEVAVKAVTNKDMCYKCKGDHKLPKCEEYNKASIDDKWKIAKDLGVCYSCLFKGHSVRTCKYKRTCKLNGCDKMHHRSLHSDKIKANECQRCQRYFLK